VIPQTTNPQRRRPQSAAMSSSGRSYPVTGYPSVADTLARSSRLARSQSQASGIVRAGGRLFSQSPIAGFTKEEMMHEAKVRQEHNRQRAKLKQLLQASAGPGNTVSIEDLMLSAKIAKMSLPDELLFKSPYANRYTASRTENGDPKEVRWQSFHSSISYPKLSTEAERAHRRSLRPKSAAPVVQQAAVAERPETPEDLGPSDDELRRAGRIIKNHMETRFTQIRKAFRTMDEDKTGTVSRDELKQVLMDMNLAIGPEVVSALIDLADVDGDGDINYAEFAALMTSDDVLAVGGGQRRRTKKKAAPREEFRLYPGGPTEQDLRKGQMMLRERINAKYNSLTAAFRTIDNDHSGRLGLGELKQLAMELNIVVDDAVLAGIIALADHDGGGDISYAEFARVLTADDVMKMKDTLRAAG